MIDSPKQPTPASNRSPNYPAIDLRSAVEKARVVFQEVGRHPTSLDVVAKIWGYQPKSGHFKVILAALRAFGLLEAYVEGKHRLTKFSPSALDIVVDYREGSSEWREAIKKAALTPKVHADMWERYSADLPADDELRRHLIRTKFFTDKAAGEFIKQYRTTLAFARFTQSDKATNGSTNNDRGDLSDEGPVLESKEDSKTTFRRRSLELGTREDVLDLDEGQVVLQRPRNLSADSFECFQDWLKVIVRKPDRST